MDAFDDPGGVQFALRHPTDTIGAEIRVSRLDTSKTAQILIALLLPFANQLGIGQFVVQTELV